MLLAQLDDRVVYLDLHGRLNGTVFKDFFQHTAVTATDDQDVARRAMGKDRRMRQHFVIDEFVPLRGLHHAVERQHPPKFRIIENYEMLVFGLRLMDDSVDAEPRAEPRMEGFLEPIHQRIRPR